MATKLITTDEAKKFIVVEHSDDDKLLASMVERAHARLQGYVRRALDAIERSETFDGGQAALFLTHWPVSSVASVVDNKGTVDTADNETLETTEYRLDGSTGMLWRTSNHGRKRLWEPGQQRFVVTYTGGLAASDLWDDYEREELAASLLDLVAYWYRHRDPALREQRDGMGVSQAWEQMEGPHGPRSVPATVRAVWDTYVVRA